MCSKDIFLGVLAIIFPPLPVWIKTGICSGDSLINILLSMLGFIPGLLHAWYVIAKYPEPTWEYEAVVDAESGRPRRVGDPSSSPAHTRYVFVGGRHGNEYQQQQWYQQRPPPQPTAAYGSTDAATRVAAASAPHVPQRSGVTGSGGGAQAQAGPSVGGAAAYEGASADRGVPPSYAEAVGDNKIQSRD